eukprot:8730902-Alexandrium_andersonii.AAC.1
MSTSPWAASTAWFWEERSRAIQSPSCLWRSSAITSDGWLSRQRVGRSRSRFLLAWIART